MLIGLHGLRCVLGPTLGNLGLDVSRDPDPVKQARQERIMKAVARHRPGCVGGRDCARGNWRAITQPTGNRPEDDVLCWSAWPSFTLLIFSFLVV